MKLLTSFALIFLVSVAIICQTLSGVLGQSSTVSYSSGQPKQPIVGILSQPNRHSWNAQCGEYVQTTYVNWLASVGVRAVPIHYDTPADELTKLLDGLNGALFTGGGLNLREEKTFYNTAKSVYDYAVASAEKDPNNKFVLWGTCQGFQLISIIASGSNFDVLECDFTGTDTSMLPLVFTENANSSRFFENLWNDKFGVPTMYNYFTKENSTGNAHNCGVRPSVWTGNNNLNSNFSILTINNDTSSKTFVSMYEHKSAAIYGSQWHPEGQEFWYLSGWNKEPATIETAHYAGFFLAGELRKNQHSFPAVNINGDTDNSIAGNDWLSTLLRQYPVVENPDVDYAGFYCVGGYPGSAKEQHLKNELDQTTGSRDIFAFVFVLTAVILIIVSACFFYKMKQLRAQVALGGGGSSVQTGYTQA